jgi:YesN/AraC family two-component response regulator
MEPLNILVVDDEDVIIKGLVNRIENMPFFSGRAIGAGSGEEALEIMEYYKPDLLITDIEMPGMNGLSLLSTVQQKNLCANCIILTAFENFNYARQAVHFHAAEYLLKPVDWDVLDRYITNLSLKMDADKAVGQVLFDYSERFKELQKTDFSLSFKRILKYAKTNFSNNISLKQLSVYSGMSENSICNLFKKEMDITYLEYIYKLRLKKSIEILLTEQKKTMKEVSAMVGYNSERQFFRMFKSQLGMTPQRFREKNLYEQGM